MICSVTAPLPLPEPHEMSEAGRADQAPLGRSARKGLLALIAVAFALRVFMLVVETSRPGFAWVDPDGYMATGRKIVEGGWHWSVETVRYSRHVKAPLYPIVLSFFALGPWSYPLSAALAQAVVGAMAVGAMFFIGRAVHSLRAGWIAAVLYALYLPAIFDPGIFLQENLHIPLLLVGFALLCNALTAKASAFSFVAAGATFGAAALVRSMPVYFLPPALFVYLVKNRLSGEAWRQVAWVMAGFAALTLPYSLYISVQMGQAILIDNMGSIQFASVYPDSRHGFHSLPSPTLFEIIRMFATTFASAPFDFLAERINDARLLFGLKGGRFLEDHVRVGSDLAALVWKAATHVFQDGTYSLTAILAPLGWVFARRSGAALFVGLWAAVNVVLLAAFTWSGARYRAPFEPHLMILGAVVLAGGWARPPRWALGLAAGASLVVAAAVIPTLPSSLAARATYGLDDWWVGEDGEGRARIEGRAGFTVKPVEGSVQLVLRTWSEAEPVRVRIAIGSEPVVELRLTGNEGVPFSKPSTVPIYLKLEGVDERTGELRPYRLRVIQSPPDPSHH